MTEHYLRYEDQEAMNRHVLFKWRTLNTHPQDRVTSQYTYRSCVTCFNRDSRPTGDCLVLKITVSFFPIWQIMWTRSLFYSRTVTCHRVLRDYNRWIHQRVRILVSGVLQPWVYLRVHKPFLGCVHNVRKSLSLRVKISCLYFFPVSSGYVGPTT